MDKKLTLSLDQQIIEKAKKYAKSHQVSLSKLIESYLQSLVKPVPTEIEITPLVKSLSGVITVDDTNLKENYKDFLMDKYK